MIKEDIEAAIGKESVWLVAPVVARELFIEAMRDRNERDYRRDELLRAWCWFFMGWCAERSVH